MIIACIFSFYLAPHGRRWVTKAKTKTMSLSSSMSTSTQMFNEKMLSVEIHFTFEIAPLSFDGNDTISLLNADDKTNCQQRREQKSS